MGGLIIRSALETSYIRSISDKLFLYISFSTPHIGYLSSNNNLINTGIWIIQKWNATKSLKEL